MVENLAERVLLRVDDPFRPADQLGPIGKELMDRLEATFPAAKRAQDDAKRVNDVVALLGFDERAVLRFIADRLLLGRSRYGNLDLRRDRRNFQGESLEEACDLAIYAAAGFLRESRRTERP